MDTLIKCQCGSEHALFYQVGSKGKKTLNYICNKFEKFKASDLDQVTGRPAVEVRHTTSILEAPEFIEGLPIPEKWTATYKKQQQLKQQHQLILMNK